MYWYQRDIQMKITISQPFCYMKVCLCESLFWFTLFSNSIHFHEMTKFYFFLYEWNYFPYSQFFLYPLISWWTGEFLLAATNQSHLERVILNWGTVSIRCAFGNVSVEFSGLITVAGGPIPLLVVIPLG